MKSLLAVFTIAVLGVLAAAAGVNVFIAALHLLMALPFSLRWGIIIFLAFTLPLWEAQ
jgi:hypothetical protein